MLLTIVIFIITLLVLVVIHELGHFLMAKKFGIKVEEFGFGIPPRAWGKKIGETLVSINWLPFGGFVRLLGEDEVDKQVLDNKRSFAAQNVWKRIVVVIAGVVMNLLLAWLIFYTVLFFRGFKTQFPLLLDYQFTGVTQQNQAIVLISDVVKNSPAEVAGIKSGDRVMSINGESIDSSATLINKTKELAGEEVVLVLANPTGVNQRLVKLTPRKNPPTGQGALGVAVGQLDIANIAYETPAQKLLAGPLHSINVIGYSGKVLGSLIGQSFKTRQFEPVSESLSGPVGITSAVNTILSEQNPLLPYLDFVGLLSLNLAFLNVLPFPALDGGRLFFLFFEAATRKKVHAGVEKWIHTAGMAILLLLMALVTFSDLHKIF